MDDEALTPGPRPDDRPASSAGMWVLLGLLGLVGAGFAAYALLKPGFGPAPRAIAGDPLLVEGRELYLERCVSCHGESGRGDGPIAASLTGPPPGDLTDDEWKHGDRPGDVLAVINQGVMGSSMPGWRGIFGEDQIPAVAAYVYYLSGRDVPEALRPVESAGSPADGAPAAAE